MNGKDTEQLLEQYEDAVFALAMNAYAEENGARLIQEYEQARQNGAGEVPPELDKKCRMLIRRELAKRRRQACIQRAVKTAGRTAAAVMVLVGIAATLVFSVDAIRTPVLNFILEHTDRHTALGTDETVKETEASTPRTEKDLSRMYGDVIPAGYEQTKSVVKDDGTFHIVYADENQNLILIQSNRGDSRQGVDTEDAVCENVKVLEHKAIFVDKDGYTVVWYDDDSQLTYRLRTTGLSMEDFWVLAEQIATANKGE